MLRAFLMQITRWHSKKSEQNVVVSRLLCMSNGNGSETIVRERNKSSERRSCSDISNFKFSHEWATQAVVSLEFYFILFFVGRKTIRIKGNIFMCVHLHHGKRRENKSFSWIYCQPKRNFNHSFNADDFSFSFLYAAAIIIMAFLKPHIRYFSLLHLSLRYRFIFKEISRCISHCTREWRANESESGIYSADYHEMLSNLLLCV